jgi:hypothetical protein
MSKTPEELHRKYIRQTLELSPKLMERLSKDEAEIISKYGVWMQQLILGNILPLTEDQEKFLEVAYSDALPTTKFEHAWVSYSYHHKGIDIVGKYYQRL